MSLFLWWVYGNPGSEHLMPWTVWWTGHKVDNWGIMVKSMPWGGDFLFPKCQHQPWGSTSLLFNGYCELLPGVKWLAGKFDHMHLSFGEYSICHHGMHRDILHFHPQWRGGKKTLWNFLKCVYWTSFLQECRALLYLWEMSSPYYWMSCVVINVCASR